jgi:hypothetical protein
VALNGLNIEDHNWHFNTYTASTLTNGSVVGSTTSNARRHVQRKYQQKQFHSNHCKSKSYCVNAGAAITAIAKENNYSLKWFIW